MSPLKLGPPDHGARGDGRGGVGERELEQEEGEERHAGRPVGRGHPVQEEELVADEAVALAELEGEADRPVQDTAEAGVEHALEQDVHRLARTGEARLERHEPRLHEEHEEGGDEHPHGVDGADEVVRPVGDRSNRAGAGRRVDEEGEALHHPEDRPDAEHLAADDDGDQTARLRCRNLPSLFRMPGTVREPNFVSVQCVFPVRELPAGRRRDPNRRFHPLVAGSWYFTMAPFVEVVGSVATYTAPFTMAADDSTVVSADLQSGAQVDAPQPAALNAASAPNKRVPASPPCAT